MIPPQNTYASSYGRRIARGQLGGTTAFQDDANNTATSKMA